MLKYPKSSLFVLLLSANLLVPLHSDFIFASIASKYSFSEVFSNYLNPLSFLLRNVFFFFGDYGIGVIQVSVFFFLALYTFRVMNFCQSYPLSFVLTLICVGTFQFAQDLHPSQSFYFLLLTLIFVSKIKVSQLFERIFWCFLYPLLSFIFILIDWRNLYWMILGLALIDYQKRALLVKKTMPAWIFLAVIFLISSAFRNYMNESFLDKLQLVSALSSHAIEWDSFRSGMNFDFAFLGILIGLFFIYNYKVPGFYRDVFVVLGLLLVGLNSYQFKVYLALWLSVMVLRGNASSFKNERAESLNLALKKFEQFIGRLSADGLIFLFLSILFVSVVSFMKLPLTEAMFPVMAIDDMVENHQCPNRCNRNMKGYLNYRFGYNYECREKLLGSETNALNHEDCDLSILNYDKYPDRWR